ncbi:hypothetical protein C0Q70_13029 [Pomacea canaliculata]|uniref:SRCR domain-containing protein n=1 Tax=Pomacea canaliculata TaxID=400727 RepID=A0A2T7P381_POMCA|nr:hypothetical protein C0Q70_13029 [Pomacea canaliculata]
MVIVVLPSTRKRLQVAPSYGLKAATAVEPSSFGPRTGRFLVAGIVCTGMESNILDCFQTFTGFSDTCSSSELGVICSDYRSHVLNFQINAEARTAVTVAENSSVRMRCEAEGRPSPHMTIVSVSNNKQEVASRPRGAVQSPDQRGEVTYDLTAAPCEAAGDYRCEVDNGDRGVNVKVIIGAAVGTVAVLVVVIIVTKSLSRHAEANTRQALETTVPLEDMKSSGATNNYYGQNARSEVMNMPQEKDIVTEDLYVNTAELAREDYDSDHEYSDKPGATLLALVVLTQVLSSAHCYNMLPTGLRGQSQHPLELYTVVMAALIEGKFLEESRRRDVREEKEQGKKSRPRVYFNLCSEFHFLLPHQVHPTGSPEHVEEHVPEAKASQQTVRPEALVVSSAMYGEGSGKIAPYNYTCRGTEASLTGCKYTWHNDDFCSQSKAVGVACVVLSTQLRLAGTRRTRQDMGRVEILFGAAWTTPCVSSFSSSLAKVICRQMNYPSNLVLLVTFVLSVILDKQQLLWSHHPLVRGQDVSLSLVFKPLAIHRCGDKLYQPCLPTDGGNQCYTEMRLLTASLDPSRVLNFQVNAGMRRVVTVPEHSPVYMRCEAEGRPSPHMTIVRDTVDKREVASRPRGAVEFSDQRNVLTYNLTAAPCEASGDYRCEVDNGVLPGEAAPKNNLQSLILPSGLFSVQLTAYPTPTVKNTLYLGQYNDNSTEGTTAWNKFYVACEANSFLPASVICNITTINMTNADEGFYKKLGSGAEITGPWQDLYVNTAQLAQEEDDSDHDYNNAHRILSHMLSHGSAVRKLLSFHHCGDKVYQHCLPTDGGNQSYTEMRLLTARSACDSSQVLSFQVNEEVQWVVTVPEHSGVFMRCEAEGRPSPHMTIVRDTGDKREVASRPRGALQLTDQRVVLTYNLTAAPYEASGNYRCVVDNGVGKDIQSIRNYVVFSSQLRLAGTRRTREDMGRVEILFGAAWTTPCVSTFSSSLAKVLCRQMNFPSKAATAVEPSSFGPRTGFLVAGIVCTGMESNILGCFQTVTGFNDTCSSPELGVICSDYRAHVLNFQINAEARTVVTVAENSSVRMRCEAEGRPSPHMTIVSASNDKREIASRPRGAVELYDQSVELTYDLTAAPCEAAGDYRCEVDNGVAEEGGVNIKVIIGAAVGTAAVLVKSLSRHAEANTRQALETTVPLEDMKSSGATNNYYGQNARSEVMNMPQEKDIMTEDLYVNTAELAREEYDSDHEYSDGFSYSIKQNKKSDRRATGNAENSALIGFLPLCKHCLPPTYVVRRAIYSAVCLPPENKNPEIHPHCGLCSVSAFQPDSPHILVFLQDIAANIMMRSVLSHPHCGLCSVSAFQPDSPHILVFLQDIAANIMMRSVLSTVVDISLSQSSLTSSIVTSSRALLEARAKLTIKEQ